MNLTENVIVLGITRYNFVNDEGQEVKGCAAHYYTETLSNEENRFGCLPSKANLPFEAYETLKLQTYPTKAIAQITLDLQRGKMKVNGFDFKK